MSRGPSAADAERFRSSLRVTDAADKPDSLPFADIGSPVSPLRARTQLTSSSSSSGSTAAAAGGGRAHSGELTGSPTAHRPSHRRSGSGPLIYSGGGSSTASSPAAANAALPAGNICPSGKIGKAPVAAVRNEVLRSGTGNYGHGSVVWGARGGDAGSGGPQRRMVVPTDKGMLEELTRLGNEMYKKGRYVDALRHYDRAVMMSSDSAACRGNRAAALLALGRVADALKDCEEAVKLEPGSARAHHRLAGVFLRLGMVELARSHYTAVELPDQAEWQKLLQVERHLARCTDARKVGDWKSTLREADAAIAAGADTSPMILSLRAEVLLRLHKLSEADSTLTSLPILEHSCQSLPKVKIFGMLPDSYVYIVRAQVDMALGRFDAAVGAAEKARQCDPGSMEVGMLQNNVKLVAKARAQGNELFKAGNFFEACIAYGEGLKYDPANSVLYCNRAACWSKLGKWEKSVEDCNEALKIQPNYTKALLRRAASNSNLERWAECVRDYEVLRKELPGDKEVAESLFHAQIALKKSRGEEVANMKFGGEVEEVTSLEQLQAAISLPGVSVVYFMSMVNQQCYQIAPSVDALCSRYPAANFLKVDISKCPGIAKMENVRIVPTFKIYKKGARVKEMICPSMQVLEYSVRHYSV